MIEDMGKRFSSTIFHEKLSPELFVGAIFVIPVYSDRGPELSRENLYPIPFVSHWLRI